MATFFLKLILVTYVIFRNFCVGMPPTKVMAPNAAFQEGTFSVGKLTSSRPRLSKLKLISGTRPTNCRSPDCMKARFMQLYYGKVYGPWLWVRFLDDGALHCICLDFAHKYKYQRGDWFEDIHVEKHFRSAFHWKDGKKIVLDAIRCHYLRERKGSKAEWFSYYIAEADRPNNAFVFDETKDNYIDIKEKPQPNLLILTFRGVGEVSGVNSDFKVSYKEVLQMRTMKYFSDDLVYICAGMRP